MTDQRLTIDEADGMLHMLLMGGEARVWMCRTTAMTQQAADTHLASDTAAAAMGRFLSGAAVLGATEPEEGSSVTVTVAGGGAGGKMIAVVRGGNLKVAVEHPQAALPVLQGRQDVAGFVGARGQMTVVRDRGAGEPYIGICSLVSGELGDDFAQYFTVSEQVPSLVALGCLNQDGVVLSAGGIVIQAMPECSKHMLSQLELRLPFFAGISRELYDRGMEELAVRWFDGLDMAIVSYTPLFLRCDCSREKMRGALIALGPAELRDILSGGEDTVMTCYFCRSAHVFTPHDIRGMLADVPEERDEMH